MEWWKQIGSTGEVRRKGKNTLFHFLSFWWKGLKFFLLSCDVSWQDAEGCAVDKYLYFILYIFPISDSPKVSLIENIPHLQIYKSCTVGHVYQSDYSNADWINRISMAAKSNTLIQFADICQLHGACLNWESNPFFFPPKDSSARSWFILSCIHVRATVLWYFGFQCFWLLEISNITCGPAHTTTHAYV